MQVIDQFCIRRYLNLALSYLRNWMPPSICIEGRLPGQCLREKLRAPLAEVKTSENRGASWPTSRPRYSRAIGRVTSSRFVWARRCRSWPSGIRIRSFPQAGNNWYDTLQPTHRGASIPYCKSGSLLHHHIRCLECTLGNQGSALRRLDQNVSTWAGWSRCDGAWNCDLPPIIVMPGGRDVGGLNTCSMLEWQRAYSWPRHNVSSSPMVLRLTVQYIKDSCLERNWPPKECWRWKRASLNV